MTSKPPVLPVADEPAPESHGTPALPNRPEFEPVVPVKKQRRSVVLLVSFLVLILLIGAGFGGYRFYLAHQVKPTAVKTATQVNTASPLDVATLGGIKVAYVTLPLTESQTFVDPVAGTGDIVVTANGHYLVRDPRGFTFDAKGNTGGNLLYDGKSVYNGQYLWQFALSANGQHYIYQLDTVRDHRGGNAELFVDGKLVQTVLGADSVYYPQVSNDGKHYAYATVKAGVAGDPYLVKDGHTIYTSTESIGAINFDGGLQHYIVVADPLGGGPGTHQVVLDGKMLYDGQGSALASRASAMLSPNGQHVLYAAAGGAVYLDGRQILQSSAYAGAAAAVTDSGAYGMVNWVANKVTTSAATYSIPSQFADACSSGCDAAYPTFALSNNGQHYIFGTQQPSLWNIDGSSVSPEGNIEGVEFVGSTLYIYRWAPDPYTGWQTYTNSQVTLKYPSSWTVVPGHYGEVDAESPAFNTSTMATDDKPGAPVIEFLRLYTDSSTVGCQDAPCQVSAVIPLNNPQLPGAVLAIVNQTSNNGTHFTQWAVASGNTKVGDTSITGVTAGTGGVYVFGQSFYYPRNPSLGLAARVTDIAGFESDSHFKDLVSLINSITFK